METRKRRLPARAAARAEATEKKATPAPTPTPAREPAREPTRPPTRVQTPVVAENLLPKSITTGKPLPTVKEIQPKNLKDTEYQSFAESRVIAESIERSRHKWKVEGLFERYWTKPVKRKAKDPPPAAELRNPPKDSMTRIGQCTLTIEPHVFEVIMHSVKDNTPKPPLPPSSQPLYRPIIQYGPPGSAPPQHQPPPSQYTPQKQTPMQMPSRHQSATGTPIKQQSPAGPFTPTPFNNQNSTPQAHPASAPPRPLPQQAPPPSQAKSSDPVIQMLAERAATDPELKALMRIVADGKASVDELKKFQSHIDELQDILRRREREAQEALQARFKAQSSTPQPMMGVQSLQPNMGRPGAPPPPQRYPPTQFHTPQQQQIRSKPPAPPKPDIAAVVFEFVGGNGDRFKFPRYSTLEYLSPHSVIASFLIVKKGSAAAAPGYDAKLDYYQPISLRLSTIGVGPAATKPLEALSRVVAPAEEVSNYMDGIMEKCTRARYEILAMRLPREVPQKADEKEREREEEEEKVREVVDGCLWGVGVGDVKLKKRKVEVKVEEEVERWRKFVLSISE